MTRAALHPTARDVLRLAAQADPAYATHRGYAFWLDSDRRSIPQAHALSNGEGHALDELRRARLVTDGAIVRMTIDDEQYRGTALVATPGGRAALDQADAHHPWHEFEPCTCDGGRVLNHRRWQRDPHGRYRRALTTDPCPDCGPHPDTTGGPT